MAQQLISKSDNYTKQFSEFDIQSKTRNLMQLQKMII